MRKVVAKAQICGKKHLETNSVEENVSSFAKGLRVCESFEGLEHSIGIRALPG